MQPFLDTVTLDTALGFQPLDEFLGRRHLWPGDFVVEKERDLPGTSLAVLPEELEDGKLGIGDLIELHDGTVPLIYRPDVCNNCTRARNPLNREIAVSEGGLAVSAEKRSWSATACCRFGRAKNPSLRKRVDGISGLFGAAKAVASHRTP
jgi:hypothetical protein